MNVFFLSRNPILAARYQCDKHVVKMVLESAQLLSTACRLAYPGLELAVYKSTHINHPCAKWVRESRGNYEWLVKHARALAEEYSFRYNKTHKSLRIIEMCDLYYKPIECGKTNLTEPPLAMPDEYKCDDPVWAYRRYYFFDKGTKIQCNWTNRGRPWWWREMEIEEVENLDLVWQQKRKV